MAIQKHEPKRDYLTAGWSMQYSQQRKGVPVTLLYKDDTFRASVPALLSKEEATWVVIGIDLGDTRGTTHVQAQNTARDTHRHYDEQHEYLVWAERWGLVLVVASVALAVYFFFGV